MKSPHHIQIEGIEVDKRLLERPDVQNELFSQTGIQQINSDNYVLGVIRNFYEDTQLPFELDYIFQMNNTKVYESINFVIRGCFNYQTKFHTEIWQGYNHLAIIEIASKGPNMFDLLKPYSQRKRWDPVLVLCKSNDSEMCKASIKDGVEKYQSFLKKSNQELWNSISKEGEECKRMNK